MVAGAQTVSQAVTHSGTDLDEREEAAAALQSKIISVTVRCTMKWPCTCCVACEYSSFLFPRRLGRFARRNVCAFSARNFILISMTLNLSGIWSGALTGPHNSYIVLPIFSNRQNTKGHKGQM